jgi:organic radical activating enzyme
MISIYEIFPTIQGEGSKAGVPSVFLRLAGCNLWSGYEKGRKAGKGTCSEWCDTLFMPGVKHSPQEVAEMVFEVANSAGISQSEKWMVVITGGEPCLQLKRKAGIELLRLLSEQCTIAIETNGTISVTPEMREFIDHITVSPKPIKSNPTSIDHIVVKEATDLKVTVPSPWSNKDLKEMGSWNFDYRYLQPIDPGDDKEEEQIAHLNECIDLASALGWRLSVQTHKLIGLP